MNTPKIEIIGQEHEVVRPDESGVPISTSVAGGIVVQVGGKIVSSSMRRRLGVEVASETGEISATAHPSERRTNVSRWDRVEAPSGGRRLIG